MNKLTIALLITLVLANIATVTLFWVGRMNDRPGRPPGNMEGRPKDFINKELKFDGDQQYQYEKLVLEHRKISGAYLDSISQAKDHFFNLLKDTTTTQQDKLTAATAISAANERLDLLTFDHFQKIRALCTPLQKGKFDEIIHQVVMMMSRPKPPADRAGIDKGNQEKK